MRIADCPAGSWIVRLSRAPEILTAAPHCTACGEARVRGGQLGGTAYPTSPISIVAVGGPAFGAYVLD